MKKILAAFIPLSYLLLLLFQTDLAMLGDLGRHLKLGEIIINCHCVPQVNLFSFTNTDFPIVNHEWLAEVIFYLVSTWFGLHGLLLFKILLIITTACLLYRVALQKGSLFWVTIFSLLCITIFSTRFNVLPELFSYLFISLFIFLIERYKKTQNIYLLWILPVLELLWVNIHIYFILGIAMYIMFVIERLIKEKTIDKKLLIISISLLLATLINPSFIKGSLLPFTVFHNYNFPVEENNSPLTIFNPNSTNGNIAYTLTLQVVIFEVLLLSFICCLFIKKQWKEIFQMGSGLMAAILGLKFMRCVSLFGLLGYIPLVQAFTYFEMIAKKHIDHLMLNTVKSIISIIVGIVVLIHISGLLQYKILQFGFAPSTENAVAFMKEADIKGKIFNNYLIGNYLIYSLYPQEQVYVDARPEAYSPAFFDEYWRMLSDEKFFNDKVHQYGINAVVFNVAYDDPIKVRPFLTRLLQDKNWVPVYGDGQVTILVRNNSVNKFVIEKYRINIPGK